LNIIHICFLKKLDAVVLPPMILDSGAGYFVFIENVEIKMLKRSENEMMI